MINVIILRNNIENLREQLHLLLSLNEPTDNSVIKCSQELDNLLVEYSRAQARPNGAA